MMMNSVVLEVGIGLALTFLLFSLILTSAQEGIESLMKGRAKDLAKTIKELLDDPDGKMTKMLYEHPLIYPMFQGTFNDADTTLGITSNLPSYIPRTHFAAALADIVSGNFEGRTPSDATPSAQVTQAFRLVDNATQGGAQSTLTGIEAWYDGAMERLSGRYKRKTQMFLFCIGFAAAAVANIDAIHVGNALATSQELRQNMVAVVPLFQKQYDIVVEAETKCNADQRCKEKAVADAKSLLVAKGLPIGRDDSLSGSAFYFPHREKSVVGWLITALAGMLGAPFWFDLLSKLMNIRAALKPPPDSSSAASGNNTQTPTTPFIGAIQNSSENVPVNDEDDCCGLADYQHPATLDADLPPTKGGVEPKPQANQGAL